MSAARAAAGTGAVALAAVVLLGVAVALRPPLPLPVSLDLQGLGTDGVTGRVRLGEVVGRLAALVPAAAAGGALLALAHRRRFGRQELLVVTLIASPIVLVLVSQVNGTTDLGVLVLAYAATAGGVLVRVLQERVRAVRPPDELPLWFASAIGLVPWGVVALHQVGALLAGAEPPVAVRVGTLLVLAATIGELVVAWRGRRRSDAPGADEVVLVAVPPLLLAVLVVLVL